MIVTIELQDNSLFKFCNVEKIKAFINKSKTDLEIRLVVDSEVYLLKQYSPLNKYGGIGYETACNDDFVMIKENIMANDEILILQEDLTQED